MIVLTYLKAKSLMTSELIKSKNFKVLLAFYCTTIFQNITSTAVAMTARTNRFFIGVTGARSFSDLSK
jgi:hypothetical protein